MGQETCAACGAATTFEEELGSAVCTSCGTLANPSQSILDSHLEHVDTSGREYFQLGALAGVATLKNRNGRSLAGQDREARDRRNTVAMREFIRTLAGNISQPGCAARAQTVFDQARAKSRFRWGRKSKLVAGAAIAIATRESNRGISLRDVAYLLEEPVASLARCFSSTCALLQLTVNLFEPTQHIPALESHLLALLRTPDSKESPIPTQLVTMLTPLIPRLPAVRQTVSSLSSLVARIDVLASLPIAPTACALLMLALEGELAASLPHAGALAQALGGRIGAGKAVVMARYKAIYDVIAECVREVPWLDVHERTRSGRSKVAKRVVVAKGLKDAVQFQDEIWRRKLIGTEKLSLVFDHDDDCEDDGSTIDGSISSAAESRASMGSESSVLTGRTLNHRRNRHERRVAEVSRFMLHPLAERPSNAPDPPCNSQELLEHFLTADDSCLEQAFTQPPTRLQLLAGSRGEAAIGDEELFEDGELEGFLRSTEEVDAVRATLDWGEDASEDIECQLKKKRKRGEHTGDEGQAGDAHTTKRINMDVLARLLDPTAVIGEDQSESQTDDGHESELDEDCGPPSHRQSCSADAEEIVEDWRPPSPGGLGFDDDRYDI